MTIIQLQYIIAIDTHRHFATAAEKCFVTQPTLSMQIRKLEEELGLPIFDRSKKPVVPTDAGKRIIEQARKVLHETQLIGELVKERKGEISGEFRLGIIPTVATSLLPRFVKKFVQQYPNVQLTIEEIQTEQIISKLHHDLLDAGILATPLKENNITEVPLYYEPFMGFIPKNHRLADEQFILSSELDPKDVLLLNQGHCFRNSIINLCGTATTNETTRIKLESGNFETLIRLAKQGMGMTLIPYLTALDLKHDKHLIKPFDNPKPGREISIVYSRAQWKMQLIKALSETITTNLPDKLKEEEIGRVVSPLGNEF
jgi:LysR family hydrogen peroxide-inducible transcriptional activator